MEEWQEELKSRESVVVKNVLQNVGLESSALKDDDNIKKALSNLNEDQLTDHLAKSWSALQFVNDSDKRAVLEYHVGLIKNEMKGRR